LVAYVHEGKSEGPTVGHVRFDDPATVDGFCQKATAYITERAIAMATR
jgi:hypothetical protein